MAGVAFGCSAVTFASLGFARVPPVAAMYATGLAMASAALVLAAAV